MEQAGKDNTIDNRLYSETSAVATIFADTQIH